MKDRSMAEMDSDLMQASIHGDVDFLKRALNSNPAVYFLTHSAANHHHFPISGNILHLSTLNHRHHFIRASLQTLPHSSLHTLLSQQEPSHGYNPLHLAAFVGSHEIVDLILSFYRNSSAPNAENKPWLAKASNGETALHIALRCHNERSARQIFSMDGELLSAMVDDEGNSPLFLAVLKDFKDFSLEIVESTISYSVSGKNGLNALHVLYEYQAESILRKLLKDHPKLLRNSDGRYNLSVLHSWAAEKKWPLLGNLEKMDIPYFRNLTSSTDYNGNTPMHISLIQGEEFFAKEIVEMDKSPLESTILPPPAWRIKNKDGNTPLHLGLSLRFERLALEIMRKDLEAWYDCNEVGESPLFLAVKNGMDYTVEEILKFPEFDVTRCNPQRRIDGQTILHIVSNCKENTGKLLVEKFESLINEPDDNGKRPIDIASEVGTAWLIRLLLTKNPSSITYSPCAWIQASKNGHLQAILAFIKYCPDFRKLCSEHDDTPLHHLNLKRYKDYQRFLAIPLIQDMLNARDSSGQTALHRAVERKCKIYAEVLLTTKGVEHVMKNNEQKTAMDLLVELCDHDDEWDAMCKRIGVNPRIKTVYIQNASSMGAIRDTLLFVAALLATLTFAAGFAVSGGLNQDTGEAILVKKASFLVFILADAYAMCCSMVVMSCLLWSMICNLDYTRVLVDRSVVILMQSLYGTIVAYMTGVYGVIHNKAFWAAIVIIVMCSLVAISANRTVLYLVLDKLIPGVDRGNKITKGNNKDIAKYQTNTLRQATTSATKGVDTDQTNDPLSAV